MTKAGKRLATFKGSLLSGHKEHAVEVPFDPSTQWKIKPQRLWRGTRGHQVVAKIRRISFESAIVPRQKRFYLLIDDETSGALKLSEGDIVRVELQPLV